MVNVSVLALMGVLAYAAGRNALQASEQGVVRAHRFELVDATGEVRAVLGFSQAGDPALLMLEEAKPAVILQVSNQYADLSLLDADTQSRVTLTVTRDGDWSGLKMADGDGRPRAVFGLAINGEDGVSEERECSPFVHLLGGDKRLRAGFEIGPGEVPSLCLRDREGTSRAEMAVRGDGSPSLAMCNAQGKEVLDLPSAGAL
jgi:hypothetical protein